MEGISTDFELKNFKAPYVPDIGVKYPDKVDGRMVPVNPIREINIDENYPYYDKSFKFRFIRFLLYILVFTLITFLAYIRYAFKIKGRKNLRKYKHLLKNGAMTISNHVQRWDFVFVSLGIRFRKIFFPVYKEHLRGKDEGFIRHAGGIPVPDTIAAMKSFNRAFDEIVEKKIWIHAYPESSRFDFYTPIRPFKKGVFTMACRYNLPIVPIAFSYRKSHFPYTIANFFRSLFGWKKLPLITVRVGEPILFDSSLSRKEAVLKMRRDCHAAVVKLAGIEDNPWPAEGD